MGRNIDAWTGPLLIRLRAAVSGLVAVAALIQSANAAGSLSQRAATPAPVTASISSNLAAQQQAAAIAAQSQNELSNVATALQAMQTAQTAARNAAAAAPNTVADGLSAGGLVPDSGLARTGIANPVRDWSGADTPTQTTSGGLTNVTINQTAAQAILSWNEFNVGKNTTVTFNQPTSNSVALNQIAASGTPSQILGAISARGQVYLIDPNGIIFGGTSQINVGALLASSASISAAQFTANGIYSPLANNIYSPSFTNAGGPVTVQEGAQINTAAPSSVTTGGGFVLLMGTTVSNAGAITTPDGQTELAAGDNFLLRPGYSTSSNQSSTTRGNEIAVQLDKNGSSLTGGSGAVSNDGVITADTGDITLAGETVAQNGVLAATTSLNVRGTIHLLASASDPFSNVSLGGDSVTLISPDLASTATALDSQRAGLIAQSAVENAARALQANKNFDDLGTLADQEENSRIEITAGNTVEFQGGSQTVAQGGQIAVSAVNRIQTDTDALLDVAGTYGVALPVSANDIAVSIQGFETRDNPQNRLTQNLRNSTVYIDRRDLSIVPAGAGGYATARAYTGGGVLEVSGYLNTTGHTIGEWTSLGGSIAMQTGATGAIVAQSGATFDIDGGSIQYQPGLVDQSYLLGENGIVYNVNTAPAYITYAGVFDGFIDNHAAWSVSQTYANVLSDPAQIREPGYTQGRAAGSLTLDSPTTLFGATIDAAVVNGPAQTASAPAGITDPYLYSQNIAAEPGTLVIGSIGNGTLLAGTTDVTLSSDIAAQTEADSATVNSKIAATLAGTTDLNAAAISQSALGGLDVLTNGKIAVTAPLTLAPGAAVSLFGSAVTIAANITDPSGAVAAGNVIDIGGTQIILAQADAHNKKTTTGDIVLARNAVINTEGLWTNLALDPTGPNHSAFENGGAVSLVSAADLKLAAGSRIDASSGAVIAANGAPTGGAGGAISLKLVDPKGGIAVGDLSLQGRLVSTGFTAGGALTLDAPNFDIGAARASADPSIVDLQPAFFQAGFSAYTLNGQVKVAPGTAINVVEPTEQFTTASAAVPTGGPVASGATLALLPLYTANTQFSAISQRPGASLTLAGGTSLTIGAGAALTVDPGQSIDLSSYGQMTIDGDLTAPGGAINLTDLATINSIVPVKTYEDGKILSVWIGAVSRISTAGLPFTAANAVGDSVAIAPAGGAINITGNDAVVLIQPGAILDASGTTASEQPNPRVNPSPILGGMPPNEPPIRLASAGGTIALASDNGLFLYGTMLAPAGGPLAAGGTLSLTLASDDTLNAQNLPDASRILTITQKDIAPPLPATLKPGIANKALVQGSGQISVAQIKAGGFGTLSFSALDAFIFHGNVTLSAAQSITLAQGVISDSAAAGSVTLNAPYVMLNGTINEQIAAGGQDYSALTVSGYPGANSTGAFTVNAGLIDVQNAVGFGGTETVSAGAGTQTKALEGFATVNLASTGDLRFLAPSVDSAANPTPQTSLISTGNVNLTAGVIFAANAQAANTATVIAGYSPVAIAKSGNFLPTGILTINRAPGAAPAEPYDIGGNIGFYAATILDSGVVWNPLGTIRFGSTALANGGAFSGAGDPGAAISFLPGSFTSVSAAGLTIPYGGTTDGVTYQVGGTALAINGTAEYRLASVSGGVSPGSITLDAMQIDIAKGATLDLAGGGTFTGQGFISGEGGSTNVLTTPLLQVGAAGGVTQPSLSADPVYAIIAGPQAPVAPVQDYTQTGATGSTPGIGAQIIIPAGVPGLPAGRYTLLPASYALNPGGYRVEFDGAASLAAPPVLALPNGSYAVSGRTGFAGTDVTGELPAGLTITPAATVQNYATYDTETYAQFLVATAAKFGAIRPALPEDAGSLNLFFPGLDTASLEDAGLTSFAPASGGAGGTLQISGAANNGVAPAFDIYGAAAPAAIPGTVDLSAAAIDAFDPAILDIGAAGGGNHAYTSAITVEQGATLSAARVTLTALNGGITLKPGAEIDTLGRGALFLDATTTGPYSDNGASVLDVGNGYLTYTNAGGGEIPGYGPITIDDGATIYSDGSIAFSTGAAVNIGVNATYGAAYLDLALPEINVGDPASVGANAAAGLTLTQAVLQRLTAGVLSAGVPAARILVLSASDSLNFFGTTGLDLSGGDVQLVINSPAIYGAGSAGDTATIKASTIVWNGDLVSSQTFTGSNPPGGVVTNGPGTGAGTLNFDAGTIIFGDSSLDRPNRNIPLNRLTLGFATVNLNATTEITANGTGTLSVYQAQALYGAPGTGGALNFNTPLLTGANEANMGFTAGGAINIAAAANETPASAPSPGAAGAEISLNAAAVTADSAIILPSGKLDIQAMGGIKFGAASNIDLEGAASTILGQPTYGAGGSLVAESATAGITQAAGGVINVSASGNNAGAVDLTADAGAVTLNGTLTGAAPAADTAGAFTIRAQTLPNFTGLNNALDAGGFFDLREFDIAEGDLTVGDGVRARTVNIAVNGGSLTVTGTIDANFGAAGSISLAAANNLVLAPSSVLAAQGTVLQTDHYGQPIEAANAPQISLTTATGELTLDRGATIDLASADGVARGNLELNVPRLGGAQSGDANILAADGVTITGAATIAVNAFATYHGLPDPNGTASGAPDALITQAYLDQINTTDTLPFMQAAATNADLASRLHGLTANYGEDFHFRPGVQITSATATGDLTVQGDLDLSGYRYGPGVNPAIYGSGEPGVLLIRAGGNLNVYGSITDGFGKPISDVGTTYATGWQLQSGSDPYGQDEILPIPVTLQANSGLAQGTTVNYAVPITAGSFAAGSVAPVKLTVAVSQTTTVAFVATSLIAGPNGQPLFDKGSIVPAGTVLPVGTTIGIGGILPFRISVGPVTWPANTPFTDTTLIGSFELGVALSQTVTLLPGSIIPANSYLIFPFGEVANNGNVNTRQAVDGTQGQLYPLGQLLPAGDMSWSIALVGGADTAAADPTLVQPASALGESGNLTLADPHYGKGPDDEPIRAFSVIRTGTGALSLIAGGALTEASDYGIYTAGAQSPPVLNAVGANPYDLPQGLNAAGGTLLGKNQTALAALAADYQANYPDGGGNVLVSAQGNLDGFVSTNGAPDGDNAIALTDTDALGAWLWLQGAAGQEGAWWLEFGALEPTGLGGFDAVTPQLEGFQGIGTLGGGNVQVTAGGNANGLNLAVASTGRVLADGTLLQTGGGNLSVTIGGAINANAAQSSSGDSGGLIADLRGDTTLNAGSIGTIVPFYQGSDTPANDPRTISPLQTELATISGGIDLAPGDGTVTVNARGDLVIDAAVNPGIQDNQTNSTAIDFAANGTTYETTGGGVTIFSLWSAATAVALNSAGGDIAPFQNPGSLSSSQNGGASNLYPPILSAVAQNGNIDFVGGSLELAPAADGTLDLLAAGSIYGGASNVTGTVVSISGADPSLETTPFNPLITVTNELTGAPIYTNGNLETGPALIAFGADTPTGALHDGAQPPAQILAGADIVGLTIGAVGTVGTGNTASIAYQAAMPFEIAAGRDIVASGSPTAPSVFLNLNSGDITSVTAGRDILESSFDIAGPGTLLVQAGRDIYQAGQGTLDSVGPLFAIDPNNRDGGAGITVIAGVGATGPDYTAFANLYLNPASTLGLQDASDIISENDAKLLEYLTANFGYTGNASGAYARFKQLGAAQQDEFLLTIYFAMLNQSGLEFNQPDSVRAKSYALGRNAIAALFPPSGPGGQKITYEGDITMFGGSGIHTDFGGAIQTLTPGGQTIIGVEGATPPGSAGLITQGSGDIDIYAQGSVLLGESRVLTTFGGNILAWSEDGDINAGRGDKTTIDYTPLQRVYDIYGNVVLSPNVPSTGAGIGTLNPIPQVVAGNINLVAPLGTVDAGEAGIRVSGNLNIAAAHVLNGANIQVQGSSSGVPTAPAVNVGALTSAGNNAGAAAAAAEGAGKTGTSSALPSIWIVEILGYGGGGDSTQGVSTKRKPRVS
jgi:filamentous hemagglutinin family protein